MRERKREKARRRGSTGHRWRGREKELSTESGDQEDGTVLGGDSLEGREMIGGGGSSTGPGRSRWRGVVGLRFSF